MIDFVQVVNDYGFKNLAPTKVGNETKEGSDYGPAICVPLPWNSCNDAPRNPRGFELPPRGALLSSTYTSKRYHLPGTKCMDGKYNHHSMCHTKGERFPWLTLYYGSKVAVGKTVLVNRKDIILIIIIIMVLLNRIDCCGGRTRNVEVRLSNFPPINGVNWEQGKKFTGGRLIGKFAGPGTNGQNIEIKSNWGWEGKTGSFLTIQMDNGEDPLNLQEVIAFGNKVIRPHILRG